MEGGGGGGAGGRGVSKNQIIKKHEKSDNELYMVCNCKVSY